MKQHRLEQEEYRRLVEKAVPLARDAYGVKVWQLPDGRILKLFRTKRLLSSARLRPYHLRFARNARRLAGRGFLVPEVEWLCRVPHIHRQGVLYRRLSGRPLSELLGERPELAGELARLLARLHEKGVYFRSVHPGNVLLCDGGRLGLIDLQDIRFFPVSLGIGWRVRNFRHLFSGGEQGRALREMGLSPFLETYLEAVPWKESRKRAFRRLLAGDRRLRSRLKGEIA